MLPFIGDADATTVTGANVILSFAGTGSPGNLRFQTKKVEYGTFSR
jgi:hypothetical protein